MEVNLADGCGNLLGDAANHLGRDANFTAAKNLTGELEQHAAAAGIITVHRAGIRFSHGSSSGFYSKSYVGGFRPPGPYQGYSKAG